MLAISLGCGGSGRISGGPAELPTIASFMAIPSTILKGDKTTLRWSVKGATSLSITYSGGTVTAANGEIVSSTSVSISPTATTSYTLIATNAAGSATAKVSVTVVDLPVINSLAASPSLIRYGQSSTLSWSVSGEATNLTIDRGVGTVTGTSVSVSPPATTTYTLIAANELGNIVTASVTVTVVSPPVITSFAANPSRISAGQSSTLSWNVSGATSLSIDNGIGTVTGTSNGFGSVSGSVTVSPTATTTYTLTATNTLAGFTSTATAQATLTFSSSFVPVVSSFSASPPSTGPGQSVTLTAVFDAGPSGTATVDPGVGTVTSGVAAATGTLNSSTTFTLTVVNGAESVTAQERVVVGNLSVFAGVPTRAGNMDGPGLSATFNTPRGVAVDIHGNVYVADSNNHTVRMITTAGGVVTVTTLAGDGTAGYSGDGGPATSAQFNTPNGVAVDPFGNVYVADTNNNIIRKITPAGVVSTLAGTAGQIGSADGTGAAAQFNFPTGLAVDASGNVYVADSSNNTIRKITPAGVVTTLAGIALEAGNVDGAAAAATFNYPNGVAVDASGNVYVADTDNKTIRKITPAGIVSTLAGSPGVQGSLDGAGAAARFYFPDGVAVDAAGYVYVADTQNFTVRRITPAGVVTTIIGKPGQVNTAPSGPLPGVITQDNGIALDLSSRKLYVSLNVQAIITAPY